MAKRKWIQPVLVVAVLVGGGMVMKYMASTRPEAKREERPEEGLLVETQTVRAAQHDVALRAQGSVVPTKRVTVQAEISGRITSRSAQLEPGGYVRQGEVLVQIDPRDYQLAVEARKAEVSRAQLELSLERGRKEVAQREWEMFSENKSVDAGASEDKLALRGPQLRTAQVAVDSATSALERAKLDLTRATIRAPFNALVLEEDVDEGQLVTPQAHLATLVGTDTYWVQVSVPLEGLRHIHPKGSDGKSEGSHALVWFQLGTERVERDGYVERILPNLDDTGAMARVLVAIDDPVGAKQRAAQAQRKGKAKAAEEPPITPILLNSYVNVEIDAPPIESAVAIPRLALRDGDQVYVVDSESKLRIRKLDIAWRSPEMVYAVGGVSDGDRIITSRIAAPVDGMSVRTETPRDTVARTKDEPASDPSTDEKGAP